MIYEVAIMNYLFYYFPQSSYSTSLVISIFLTGMGMGAYITYKYKNFGAKELVIFQALIGVYAFFILARAIDILDMANGWGLWATAILLIIPISVCLGTVFPLTTRLTKVDNEIGDLYTLDLLGGVVGTCLAGFILIPTFGNNITILSAACISISTIPLIVKKRRVILTIFLIGGVGFTLYQTSAGESLQSTPDAILYIGNTEFYEYRGRAYEQDSQYGLVEINESVLWINKRPQCYVGQGMEPQYAYEMSQLINKTNTKEVLMIGLGCGKSAAVILSETNASIVILEINPKVVEVNKKITNILEDPRIELIKIDGWNYMRANKKKYDVIVVEIEDPLAVSSSGFYTVEGFKLMKSNLKDRGVLVFYGFIMPPDIEDELERNYVSVLVNTAKTSFKNIYDGGGGTVWATDQNLGMKELESKRAGVSTLEDNVIASIFQEKEHR